MAIAKANAKAAEEKTAKAAAREGHSEVMLIRHARDQVFPTFLACFGFMWGNVFGFALVGAGIAHALTIGLILSGPASVGKCKGIIGLTLLSSACACFAMISVFFYLMDIPAYLAFDPLIKLVMLGALQDGVTVVTPRTEEELQWIYDFAAAEIQTPSLWICFALYMLVFVYALAVDFMTVVCSVKCIRSKAISK